MDENNIKIIEEIKQREIANFIKNNREKDKKEIVQKVEQILSEKEEMYNLSDEELMKKLKNK